MSTLQEALDKCERVAIESGAWESYKAVGEAFTELRTTLAQQGERKKVGDSRFESWYSETPISHERKQSIREAYEAGMNDILVAPAPQPALGDPTGCRLINGVWHGVAAQAQPLSDAQIKALWAQYCGYPGGILDFARAIESAHGIGGAT